ncbi:hypothetical protein [Vibrio sp. 10N.261.55.A7]|uniref:hypothetical protein n=1 Tax=Vibrio sp. 10N.261.55.A7 TaxID=1880851 RepID=UPI000C852895|nr:hypothetical protein [Vibrio sp. 10N.261.55.A7]PMJ89671.1 hypothetical protein BCU12_13890 [Vibrio sp. 10N.261.55.A7]
MMRLLLKSDFRAYANSGETNWQSRKLIALAKDKALGKNKALGKYVAVENGQISLFGMECVIENPILKRHTVLS